MKTLLIKGVALSTLTLTILDYSARGYVSVRNDVLGAASDFAQSAVLAKAEALGFELRPKMSDDGINDLIDRKSIENGFTPNLGHAFVAQESSYNVEAVSEAGALGLMQVMPFHLKNCGLPHAGYLKDPEVNLDCGFKVLRDERNRHKGDLHKTIQAYFGGPGCVDKDSCPKTQKYVKEVLARLAFLDK